MKRIKMAFNILPKVTIYLQNNSNWYGEQLSSSIISCDLGKDEGQNRMKKLAKFLEKRKIDKPVKWTDVMDRTVLFDESYEDEQAGDLIRDNCSMIRNVEMNGGFLFGGSDGLKYVHLPSMEVEEGEDIGSKWSRPVVTMFCRFTDKHECKVEMHKDSTEKLKKMQDIMRKTFVREEIKKWSDHPSKKSAKILEKNEEMLESIE